MFARTERLLLRPSWPEDAGAILAAISDEGIVRNLAQAPWPYELKDAQEFAERSHDQRHPNFMLWKRSSGIPVLVGCCGLGKREEGVELGYWIARPFWGLGYATEAAQAVVDMARSLGHRRLLCSHFKDNPASGAVMRKIGFRPTGCVEKRHSKGRGFASPCVVMELDVEATRDSDDSESNLTYMLPYDAELRAA